MKRSKILSIILAIAGQGLLIACMVIFFAQLPTDVLVLDTVVASICYWILALTVLLPLAMPGDSEDSAIASLGVRWYSQKLYIIAAVLLMVIMGWQDVAFKYQILVQGILLLLFVAGIAAAARSGEQADKVAQHESVLKSGVNQMRTALNGLRDTADSARLVTPQMRDAIRRLAENARFTAPCLTAEAIALEEKITNEAEALQAKLLDCDITADKLQGRIHALEVLVRQRAAAQN